MPQLVSDDFNRADAVNLGANWTNVSNTMDIVSTQCKADQSTNNFNHAFYSGAGWTGGADQYAEAKIIALESGKDMAPVVRSSAGGTFGNGYLFTINDTDAAISLGSSSFSVAIFKIVTGTFTQVGTSVTGVTVNANDVIRVEVTGTGASTVIVGKINGSTIITRTDAAGSVAAGNPGLTIGSGFNSIWDDFAAGDFSGATLTWMPVETLTQGLFFDAVPSGFLPPR